MFAQTLFYYTTSGAIILITILICVLLICWLMVLRRIAKIFDRVDKTVETIKDKIKISAFMGLVSQGIHEITEFVKETRANKKEKKD